MKTKKEPIKSFAALGEALGIQSVDDTLLRATKKEGKIDLHSDKNTTNKIKNYRRVEDKSTINQNRSEIVNGLSKAFEKARKQVRNPKELKHDKRIPEKSEKNLANSQQSHVINISKSNGRNLNERKGGRARIFDLSRKLNCQSQAIITHLSQYFEKAFNDNTLLNKDELDVVLNYFVVNEEKDIYKWRTAENYVSPLRNTDSYSHNLSLIFEKDIFLTKVEKYLCDGRHGPGDLAATSSRNRTRQCNIIGLFDLLFYSGHETGSLPKQIRSLPDAEVTPACAYGAL